MLSILWTTAWLIASAQRHQASCDQLVQPQLARAQRSRARQGGSRPWAEGLPNRCKADLARWGRSWAAHLGCACRARPRPAASAPAAPEARPGGNVALLTARAGQRDRASERKHATARAGWRLAGASNTGASSASVERKAEGSTAPALRTCTHYGQRSSCVQADRPLPTHLV